MKNHFIAWIVGFLFALGLGISGMTQPEKIIGFLDFFGTWDPSLMFVMGGSIAVHFTFFRFTKKRHSPLFSKEWHLPKSKAITPSLVVGSIIFGLGWGLAGYCPGPAIVSLASFQLRPLLFVAGMAMGMFLFRKVDQKFRFNR